MAPESRDHRPQAFQDPAGREHGSWPLRYDARMRSRVAEETRRAHAEYEGRLTLEERLELLRQAQELGRELQRAVATKPSGRPSPDAT